MEHFFSWNTTSDTKEPVRNWDEFYVGGFLSRMYYLRYGIEVVKVIIE